MSITAKCNKTLRMCCLLLGLVFCTSFLFAQTYGLRFQAQNVTLDKRTELNLTPDDFLQFQDEFEISFQYKTIRINPNSNIGFFGYVFRIVNENDENIDLLSTPTPDIGLNLVIGKSNEIIPVDYPSKFINNWINLRIKFMLADDRLIFYTPDTFYVQENVGFKKKEKYKIIFGANDYKQFKNSDLPSMTIRDIEISERGKLKYKWALDEGNGNVATDKLGGREARVTNPIWLINTHQNWQLNFSEDFSGYLMNASDAENGKIFIIGEEFFYIYSAQRNTIQKINYKNKPRFINNSYRAVYNTTDKRIYCYLVDHGPFYSLNIETGEWNDIGIPSEFVTSYRHHNSYFNSSENSVYLFGGYGLHRYKNEVWKINLTTNKFEELSNDGYIFSPRYLAGLGALNDTIYILGGYGSKTGNQLINPQSYFDLIGYSLKDSNFFKKFEISHFFDDMAVGNSIWINPKSRDYFALIFSKIRYDGSLQLIKGNLGSPDVEMVGDKIPFQFLDIRSSAYLFYMPIQDKLYTYTSYTTDSTTQVAIYSIDNPPDIASVPTEKLKREAKSLSLYAILSILLLFGVFIWWNLRKRKTDEKSISSIETEETDKTVESGGDLEGQVIEQLKYNLIFFGGFQIFSKELIDITNKFSPLLKELFLLILLHSFKNDKGISSNKITEVLWKDKSEKSARNNRAVNIAKLRSILELIGSCELSKKTGYWKIVFKESDTKCDYVDFLNITASKNNLTKQKVNQLLKITQKGAFLLNVHYDWLDDFKASVSDTIVDTLVEFAQSRDIKAESDFIVHLADSIFNFDVINEDAMILKCKAQYCLGKHSHAKATYEKFFKEYLSMYGQEYDRAFLDILEIKD